ncbi:unnamed protein product [Acanthoscelides obtectus]|uniref:C2H2-type domain-containing protein n=1 Tax=Acanthoscelides obtectus TaxID=200917 RepID=A0A9P0PU22_ACAOB|nr:unnamed protein product [Acanthoscelides obtectus]CAK1646609.1 Zinc finger protein 711 [Acanthoscelides obtectus]
MDLDPDIIKIKEEVTEETENGGETVVEVEPDYVNLQSTSPDESCHDSVSDKPDTRMASPGLTPTESIIDFHFLSGFESQDNEDILRCPFCPFTTRNKSTFRNHKLIQHKEPKEWYKCEQCTYETHVRSNMTKHVTAMHTTNYIKYTCERCNKVFKEKKALDDHIVKTYPALTSLVLSKIHSCPICPFKTTYKNNWSQHMLTHTKDNAATYKCTNCDYTSYRKSDVMKHLKIHSKVKEFKCTACDKEFGRKDHLDEHIIRQHSDNDELTKSVTKKISICKQCDYRTTKVTSLRKHELAHHS